MMPTDYLVASLPTLSFGLPAPLSQKRFEELVPPALLAPGMAKWADLETQLRNAVAEACGGDRFKREAAGCSLFWKNRVLACFQEKDIARRDELLDKVWWDAAEELTSPAAPLGSGALATYAVRLGIALKRGKISKEAGNVAFDRLTAASRLPLGQQTVPFNS